MSLTKIYALSLFLFFLGNVKAVSESTFTLKHHGEYHFSVDKGEEKVVHIATELLQRDAKAVLDIKLTNNAQNPHVIIGTIGQSSLLDKYLHEVASIHGKHEAFILKVLDDGRLVIAGSDKRGTAYGILELSRLLGVSPWEWWADVTPAKLDSFRLPSGFRTKQSPSVEYRGIFINDEDWGLKPWSSHKFEKEQGDIGPKTYARVCELLLRLRANMLAPAMHSCTTSVMS